MTDRPAEPPPADDPWRALRRFTAARIGLGRAGCSLPTAPLLQFQLAHARARDAVQAELDTAALQDALKRESGGAEVLLLDSGAPDRRTFVQRPDLGRILSDASRALLAARPPPAQPYDIAMVVADGLSARAVQAHAVPLIAHIVPTLVAAGWTLAPVCIVRQGRVAIADEIGALLPARLAVILIGERPGLSSPDSLGIYLTWEPLPGRSNAQRNCISNVRPPQGLSYPAAAHRLWHLMTEARRRRLSGVELKEDAPALPEAELARLYAPRGGYASDGA
jgi:ethanolamine ammonia-lyase small subunit